MLSKYAQDQLFKAAMGRPFNVFSGEMYVGLLDESPTSLRQPHEVTYEGYSRLPTHFKTTINDQGDIDLTPLVIRYFPPLPPPTGLRRWLCKLPLIGRFFKSKLIIRGWAVYDRLVGGNLIFIQAIPALRHDTDTVSIFEACDE
jgi:hypothetical protein